MHITVCICTRNRGSSIMATLQSLVASTYADFDVVIIDQSASDDTAQAVEQLLASDARFHYLRSATVGKSIAQNMALAQARGPIIAFTDDDCEVQADWLAVLAECFEADPEVGSVGGALIAPKRLKRFGICPHIVPRELVYDPARSGRQPPLGWMICVGGNMAFRRSAIERVGPFDEYLGPGTSFPASDDDDYMLRLEALGIKMLTTPRAVVYHTYGYRYGVRAMFRIRRNYIRGDAGLGGKLTLSGDPRGKEWLAARKAECTSAWFRKLLRGKLPVVMLRLWIYTRAYQECLRHYRIDPKTGMLSLLEAPPKPLGGVQSYPL